MRMTFFQNSPEVKTIYHKFSPYQLDNVIGISEIMDFVSPAGASYNTVGLWVNSTVSGIFKFLKVALMKLKIVCLIVCLTF